MSNLKKPMERLSELLDEMVDKMDIDETGNPDDAMRWATQLSDALVRLKRHAKADTKTHTDLCQAKHKPRDTKKWRVDDLVVDIKGNIYIIEGVKANSFLVKDTDDNLYLIPADELTWHSRPQQEQQK